MASKTVVTMVDDLDGESEATMTAVFAWEGRQFEVDLTQDHFEELSSFLQRYMIVGRAVGRTQLRERRQGVPINPQQIRPTRDLLGGHDMGQARTPARPDRLQLKAIRDWAGNNGYKVSDRGRIPANVEQAFQDAMAPR